MRKYCVLYMECGAEMRSPWFTSRNRARTALDLILVKHGAAVIYAD